MSPAEPDRSRASDVWLIRGLIEQLRFAGFRIGPKEYEQVLFVAACQPKWLREELRQALAVLLEQPGSDRSNFNAIFDAVIPVSATEVDPFSEPPSDTSPVARPTRTAGSLPATSDTASRPDQGPIKAIALDSERKVSERAISQIWSKLLSDRLGWAISLLLVGGIAAVLVYYFTGTCNNLTKCPFRPPSGEGSGDKVIPAAAWILAASGAAGLLGPTLFVLRWLTRNDAVIVAAEDPSLEQVNETAFRVGLVGGPPPFRVTAARLKNIVDLFSYQEGVDDFRDLDVGRTIDAVIRAGGMPELRFRTPRVLPVVIVLTDGMSRGRSWNSTCDELVRAFARRGLDVIERTFQGSLHEPDRFGGTSPQISPLGREIAAIVEDEPSTVVMVFSEGGRWSEPDSRLLASFVSSGPVIWFDDRDRELWDVRLDSIRRRRIPIYEGTDLGVEEALRWIYAPGRGIGTPARTAGAALARRRKPTLSDEVGAILGSAIGWARHCALLEPISVAVAERIRAAFHRRLPWFAFSRFCALPGSTIGPDGLRFDPEVRAMLLDGFARQEPTRLRDDVVQFITDILEQEAGALLEDSAAYDLCRLATMRVAVHSQPDEAIREIAEIRQRGLVDPGPIDRFLKRLQPLSQSGTESSTTLEQPIRLAKPIRHIETLKVLRGYRPVRHDINRSAWNVSAPELRIGITAVKGDDVMLAAFVHDDVLAIVQPSGDNGRDAQLSFARIPSGVEHGEPTLLSGGVAALAARDGVAALATSHGMAVGFFVASTAEGGRIVRRDGEQSELVGLPYVSTEPPRAVVIATDRAMLIGPDGPERTRPLKPASRPTAACGLRGDLTLVGYATGEIAALRTGASAEDPAPLIRLPGAVTALTSVQIGPPHGGWTVAAAYTAGNPRGAPSGYVALFAMADLSVPILKLRQTLPVAGLASSIEMSSDRTTLLILWSTGLDIVALPSGLSLLANDASVLFASLGSGSGTAVRVAAASLGGRRVAVLTNNPPRLEVRRLERRDGDAEATTTPSAAETPMLEAEEPTKAIPA